MMGESSKNPSQRYNKHACLNILPNQCPICWTRNQIVTGFEINCLLVTRKDNARPKKKCFFTNFKSAYNLLVLSWWWWIDLADSSNSSENDKHFQRC